MAELAKRFSKNKFEATLYVDEKFHGKRLDTFIQDYLVSFSREQVKKKIKRAEVRIKERPFPHRPSTKVYYKEIIFVTTERSNLEDVFWDGKKIDLQEELDIIYQDKELVAINKPPFMSAHPTGRHLFYCATVYLEEKFKQTVHSVHRLDRETSGVMLICLTPESAKTYTQYFEDSKVKKLYFFIAHKKKTKKFPFCANERLGEKGDFIPRMFMHAFTENSKRGKRAKTLFYEILSNDQYTLGLASPLTGRQHQIRAHSSFHGLPLLGDKLYNGDPNVFRRYKDNEFTQADLQLMQLPRHALHAVALYLPGEKQKVFKAQLPDDLKNWITLNLNEISITTIEQKINHLIDEIFQIV